MLVKVNMIMLPLPCLVRIFYSPFAASCIQKYLHAPFEVTVFSNLLEFIVLLECSFKFTTKALTIEVIKT